MLDELIKLHKDDIEKAKQEEPEMQEIHHSDEYVDGYIQAFDDYKNGRIDINDPST